MGSSRLPGKVMMPLAGHPLVWHIAKRLHTMPGLAGIVLATTTDPRNDPMVEFMKGEGATVTRSPYEDDIADRLCRALDATGADTFVKVNADCPLFDPDLAQELLAKFQAANADFATNKLTPSYPLGYSLEIIGARAIRWCDEHLTEGSDREMMIKWIMDHAGDFTVAAMQSPVDLSSLNLTVDTPADYELMSQIFSALFVPGTHFGLAKVVDYLSVEKVAAGVP